MYYVKVQASAEELKSTNNNGVVGLISLIILLMQKVITKRLD